MVFWRRIKNKMKTRAKATLQAASLLLSAYFFPSFTLFSREWQQITVVCTYVQSPSRLRQLNFSMRVCTSGCNKAAFFGLVCMHPVNRGRAVHLMQTHLSEEVDISETLSQQQDVSVPALLGAPAQVLSNG